MVRHINLHIPESADEIAVGKTYSWEGEDAKKHECGVLAKNLINSSVVVLDVISDDQRWIITKINQHSKAGMLSY